MTELPVVSKESATQKVKKPDWLRVKLPIGENYKHVRGLVDNHKLHTICESGNCPNMGECWGEGTATFMILGNVCTRSCGFCAVATGRPEAVDWDEPQRVAETIYLMKVKHAVITSVDRDELKDGGSTVWYNTIKAVHALNPGTTLETLIPDFKGKAEDIQRSTGIQCMNCLDSIVPYCAATILKFIAVNRRDHRMFHFHQVDGFGYPLGFVPIHWFRTSCRYRTKAATAGAHIAQDHKGGRAFAPAFTHIRAVAAFADGMELMRIDEAAHILITLSYRQLYAQPVRLLDAACRFVYFIDNG